MKVSQIMSLKPITAVPGTSFEKLWKLIFEKRISGLPIVTGEKELLGVVSEEDLIERLYPTYEEYFFDPHAVNDFEKMEKNLADVSCLSAKNIMNKNVFTATPDTPIMKAASNMLVNHVSCLPVIRIRKKKKILVGIICKGDIFGHLFKTRLLEKRRR